MGTGIVSILLHNLPYNATWLYWISVGFFALNIFLFSVFLLISILRYGVYVFCQIMHSFSAGVPNGVDSLLSEHLAGHDSPSGPVPFCGDIPNGVCDHNQHDYFHLCARMGILGCLCGKAIQGD